MRQQLFHDKGMKDKERLLHYRRSSRVNIYELDGHQDYYYGYMFHPRDTSECLIWSYMKTALFFCSQIKREIKVEPLHTSNKLYHTLKESRSLEPYAGRWNDRCAQ